MSRRRAWIWIAFGLMCAIGAAALAYFTLQDARNRASQEVNVQPTNTPEPSMLLPVASRRLEVGTTLTDADVTLTDYPLRLVPVNAISDTQSLRGGVLVANVELGEYFRTDAVAGRGGALSNSIPQGKEIFAFPIIDLLSTADVIQPGDHVDLLLTVNIPVATGDATPTPGIVLGGTNTNRIVATRSKITGYTVQNVEIFRVVRPPRGEEEQAAPPPTMFLMLLEPQQLLYVKYVKDYGGTIDLALRSPLDKEPFRAGPIEDQDLFDLLDEGTIKATPTARPQ